MAPGLTPPAVAATSRNERSRSVVVAAVVCANRFSVRSIIIAVCVDIIAAAEAAPGVAPRSPPKAVDPLGKPVGRGPPAPEKVAAGLPSGAPEAVSLTLQPCVVRTPRMPEEG